MRCSLGKKGGSFLEGISLCKALWTGKEIDWDGTWKVQRGTLGPTHIKEAGHLFGEAEQSRER